MTVILATVLRRYDLYRGQDASYSDLISTVVEPQALRSSHCSHYSQGLAVPAVLANPFYKAFL